MMRIAMRIGRGTCSRWAALLTLAPGLAAAQEYHVDRDADRLVRFISEAPIEDFDGVTDRIDGFALFDSPTLDEAVGGESTRFYFEVDLASIDTGIGLRNRHMRDNYLEVEQFPYATFEGTIADVRPMASGPAGGAQRYRLTATGAFAVHGVSRQRSVSCALRERGEAYRVTCAFEVLLGDHDIAIPQVMFLKLAEEIRLELDFALRPAR